MARFVVDLGEVKLTAEQHSAIAGAIQGAVLAQLGHLKVATTENRLISKTGGGWAGMIMVKSIAEIEPIEKRVESFTHG